MTVKLQTEHHLEFLCLKGGCTGSSESTQVKMPHCWKSHITAQIFTALQIWSYISGPEKYFSLFYVSAWKFIYRIIHSGWSQAWIFMMERVKMTCLRVKYGNYFYTWNLTVISLTFPESWKHVSKSVFFGCIRRKSGFLTLSELNLTKKPTRERVNPAWLVMLSLLLETSRS